MSVLPSDIGSVLYGSQNMPEADNITVGGVVDFSRSVTFYDAPGSWTTGPLDFVSSSALDTHVQIQVAGRDSTGVIQTPAAVTLNGVNIVAGAQSFQRLLYGAISGASPNGPLSNPASGANTTLSSSATSGASTISVASSANFPGSGNVPYNIAVDTGTNFEIMTVTNAASASGLTWNVTRGQSGFQSGVAHASGVSVYLMPIGDVAALNHTRTIAGHAFRSGSAHPVGTTPAVLTLQTGDGATAQIGMIVRITSGGANNALRRIIAVSGYGADTVAIDRDLTSLPASGDTYDIAQGMLFPNGAFNGSLAGQVSSVVRAFSTSAADVPTGSQRTYYEYGFIVNNNAATAFTGAQVEIASETPVLPGSAALDLALALNLNDQSTVANRQTAPATGAYTAFSVQPAFVSVPGSGNLPPGVVPNFAGAQKAALRLTLPAGTAAYEGMADVQVKGTTV